MYIVIDVDFVMMNKIYCKKNFILYNLKFIEKIITCIVNRYMKIV